MPPGTSGPVNRTAYVSHGYVRTRGNLGIAENCHRRIPFVSREGGKQKKGMRWLRCGPASADSEVQSPIPSTTLLGLHTRRSPEIPLMRNRSARRHVTQFSSRADLTRCRQWIASSSLPCDNELLTLPALQIAEVPPCTTQRRSDLAPLRREDGDSSGTVTSRTYRRGSFHGMEVSWSPRNHCT